MGRIVSFIKGFFKRRNTNISPLAILHSVEYTDTTAIKALAKLERAKVGRCTYFHVKKNATGICFAENSYQWNQKTYIGKQNS